MKMDIGTPVELMSVEYADFGNARHAYLTFLNESQHVIAAISGRVLALNGDGDTNEDQRISFGDIHAVPGATFVCQLSMSRGGGKAALTMLVEDVVFEDNAEPWALHPLRLKEYPVPVLEEGPQRNALIAMGGRDAVCFPEQVGNTWRCICGRYNRWRWTTCRRCRRERDRTLEAFEPETLMRAYAKRLERAKQTPPRVIVDGGAMRRRAQDRRREPVREKRSLGWIPGVIIAVALVAALIWGVSALQKKNGQETETVPQAAQTATPVPFEPDYLDPVT